METNLNQNQNWKNYGRILTNGYLFYFDPSQQSLPLVRESINRLQKPSKLFPSLLSSKILMWQFQSDTSYRPPEQKKLPVSSTGQYNFEYSETYSRELWNCYLGFFSFSIIFPFLNVFLLLKIAILYIPFSWAMFQLPTDLNFIISGVMMILEK